MATSSPSPPSPARAAAARREPVRRATAAGSGSSFGSWLRQQRRRRGLSQDGLAVQANCGVGTIRRFEQKAGIPDHKSAHLLAAFFAIPADELDGFVEWARQISDPPPSVLSTLIAPVSAPLSAPGVRPHLPISPTPLVGRESQVAALVGLLAQDGVRLVTLTGPGGIGKTRLALAVAHAVAASSPRVTFVSLASVLDPAKVPSILAGALAVLAAADPAVPGPALLVLDNFEHLMAAVTSVADVLGQHTPVTILVTSREVLRLYGEHEFAVKPLPLPCDTLAPDPTALSAVASVDLFVQRVRAVKPDFSVTAANAAAIAAICRHMEGLPLALELVAARAKVLSPPACWPACRIGSRS